MPDGGEVDIAQVRDEISREITRVHSEAYGTGFSSIAVHVLDDTVLVLVDLEVSQAERTLLDAGKWEAVRDMRESFQEAIGPTFIAIVERATGRRVKSFLSRMSPDPLFAVELFRLEPKQAPLAED